MHVAKNVPNADIFCKNSTLFSFAVKMIYTRTVTLCNVPILKKGRMYTVRQFSVPFYM